MISRERILRLHSRSINNERSGSFEKLWRYCLSVSVKVRPHLVKSVQSMQWEIWWFFLKSVQWEIWSNLYNLCNGKFGEICDDKLSLLSVCCGEAIFGEICSNFWSNLQKWTGSSCTTVKIQEQRGNILEVLRSSSLARGADSIKWIPLPFWLLYSGVRFSYWAKWHFCFFGHPKLLNLERK